ncbi:DNAJ heat shock N-terminal domain-containing protein [Striga asiatica]|uniref:DNAJ heat shock N-terminal domain-containing protein n=1 Tax=Striga asiatica TaxID=4170 RepID=A0A5A7R8Z5_STRAF|nr:DNAJ heat shock N-terminal domain-containing protein [Striga asiatica]
MGSNIEEAVRAKAFAEQQFMQKNFAGAKNLALKAQMLCPELEGISQMVATFGVYTAYEAKINGEPDFYSILGLDPCVDRSKIKKQYKKMAFLLHPDKNKTAGADGAFRLVSEAWALLSDNSKRSSYDQRRHLFSSSHRRLDTFWTVCTSCHVQYEYLRKYVNKRLSCKNCRGVFVAAETGLGPHDGVFPYGNYSYAPENGYAGHSCGVTYVPTTTGYCGPNGASAHHTGYRTEYVSNISFQGTPSRNLTGIVDANGLSSSSFTFYQANGEGSKSRPDGKHQKVNAAAASDGYTAFQGEIPRPKRGRPPKKIKSEPENNAVEPKAANGSATVNPENLTRRVSAARVIDTRQLLIAKGRSVIRMELEEMMREAEETERRKALAAEACKSIVAVKIQQPELKRSVAMSITVPDSDFHDFDKDRSEECFKPKQIWALYDEDDGMPRLYCLIRDVISLNPFKIFISYLSSRSDTEFGLVNWLDSGFTKSCGNFRVFHSETIEQVNIFSHLLSREKAGRGGCVRIYPRKRDIWAVYKNWSPDWDRSTPTDVRHQYEIVEVLDEYSEEKGVWVRPVIKLDGYKTVYQRNRDDGAARWIPRREMLRFSHQVPSFPLEVEKTNLPEGCWDLDPAATPDEFLRSQTDLEDHKNQGKVCGSNPDERGSIDMNLG